MSTKIQKWGNSLAVRLPQHMTKKLGLKAGSIVAIEEEGGKIIKIKPTQPKKFSLKEMVRKIKPENLHEEVDWGSPVGKEIW